MLHYVRDRNNLSSSFRRHHERKNYCVDIVFAINEQIFKGHLKDISIGGAFLFTPHVNQLWEGDLVTISIPFTDGRKHVKRSGHIIWKNSTGFAIAFTY